MKAPASLCSLLFLIQFSVADDASTPASAASEEERKVPVSTTMVDEKIVQEAEHQEALIQNDLVPLSDTFDYPVGAPDGKGYHVSRGFSPGGLTGELWDGDGGGNTAHGDPVTCTANGLVVYARDAKKGWGNVVIVRHRYHDSSGGMQMIDSLYGKLHTINVKEGDLVNRGHLIGTIGRGPHNMYPAMLHFEIRKNLGILMNRAAFEKSYDNYHSPSHFIESFRKKQ